MAEQAAFQELAELAFDEGRHVAIRCRGVCEKGLEVLLDDAIEKCLLRRAARILGQDDLSRDRNGGKP